MLIENLGVRRYRQGGESPIESSYTAEISGEWDHLSKLSYIRSFFYWHGLSHEISINIDGIRIKPGEQFTVWKAGKHIITIIPLETIHYGGDFHQFWLVINHRDKHVSVIVNKAHFSFRGHFYLVKLQFNYLSWVLNMHITWFTTYYVENFYQFVISGVNQSHYIRADWDVPFI